MFHSAFIAAVQWVLADVHLEANASLPTIRHDAFRPKLPSVAAAGGVAIPKSIRLGPNHKLPPPIDNMRADAVDDAGQTVPRTCG